jgi:colanic acid/amylovoran biosynthesis glycosyltransferase
MRIMYIVRTFPKGSETFVSAEISHLHDLGHQIEVFNWTCESGGRVRVRWRIFLAILDVRGLWTCLSSARKCQSWRRKSIFRRLQTGLLLVSAYHQARRFKPDVVHAHFASMPTEIATVLARSLGCPATAMFHAKDYIPRLGTELLDAVIADLDRVFMVSRRALADVQSHHPVALAKSQVVRASGAQISVRPRLLSPSNQILCVGRLVEKKGHVHLLRAMQIVFQVHPEVRLTIIGEGPLRQRIESFTRELGIAEHVRLLGALSHAETLHRLAQADAVALICVIAEDGDVDGLPVALVEAARMGVPSVTSAVAATEEVIFDGVNGYIVRVLDPQAIADKIMDGLAMSQSVSPSEIAMPALREFDPVAQAKVLQSNWESLARP